MLPAQRGCDVSVAGRQINQRATRLSSRPTQSQGCGAASACCKQWRDWAARPINTPTPYPFFSSREHGGWLPLLSLAISHYLPFRAPAGKLGASKKGNRKVSLAAGKARQAVLAGNKCCCHCKRPVASCVSWEVCLQAGDYLDRISYHALLLLRVSFWAIYTRRTAITRRGLVCQDNLQSIRLLSLPRLSSTNVPVSFFAANKPFNNL